MYTAANLLANTPAQLLPARELMAFTPASHILLVPWGVALPFVTLVTHYRGLRKADPAALLLARRWSAVTAVQFAVGVVTVYVLVFGAFLTVVLKMRSRWRLADSGAAGVLAGSAAGWARYSSVAAVALLVGAWGFAQKPYLVPTSLTVQQGAGASAPLQWMLVVAAVALVLIGPALVVLYRLDTHGVLEPLADEDVAR